MPAVRVRVPATTGNLGSGYDCIGMALGLYNTIELSDDTDKLVVEAEGEGVDLMPLDESNLCVKAARTLFETAGFSPGGLKFRLRQTIPVSRGLGSSGAAIVGGAMVANIWAGNPLDTDEVLRLCTRLEGHPDNVVPSLVGGLSVSGERDGRIVYRSFKIPSDLKAIAAVPDFTLDTAVARSVLPDVVPMRDAVYNLCSVGLMIGGILDQDYALLRQGMDDRLHQPYRKSLIPGFTDVLSAALEAGAHGAALSGAGPTLIALASHHHQTVAEAMSSAFKRHEIKSRTFTLPIDNAGTQVIP